MTNPATNLESTSCITPLKTVDDETLLNTAASGLAADGDFLSSEKDKSLKRDDE